MRVLVFATLVLCALCCKAEGGEFSVIKPSEVWEQQFDGGLVEQLAEMGPLADIGAWAVLPHDAHTPNKFCEDLRLKVWVVVHLPQATYTQDAFAHVTALRLDGVGEHPERKANHPRCLLEQDQRWRSASGWPNPLLVVLCPGGGTSSSAPSALDPNARTTNMMIVPTVPHPNTPNCVTIEIPATGTTHGGPDVLRMRVRVPGLKPIPIRRTQIPRRIVQVTQDTHRAGAKQSHILLRLSSTMRIMNPGYDYYDVAADELADTAENLGGQSARSTLEQLQPIAYRVDYFRVLELLHHGGVYADSKLVPLFPFDSFLPEEGALFPMDMKPARVWNGFIAFPPGDPLLVAAVAEIDENVKRRYYGKNSLEPTGPASFYRAWMQTNVHRKSLSEPKYTHDFVLGTQGLFIQSLQTGAPVLIVHNSEYRRLHSWASPCFYSWLHLWGAVYHEIHCDPVHGLPWYFPPFLILSRITWWSSLGAAICFVVIAACRLTLKRMRRASEWNAIPQIELPKAGCGCTPPFHP